MNLTREEEEEEEDITHPRVEVEVLVVFSADHEDLILKSRIEEL